MVEPLALVETPRDSYGGDALWLYLNQMQRGLEQQLADLRLMLDERHTAQSKAIDAALASADRAMLAALHSAEKAVDKAETATAHRFDSVNEFRQQLNDQTATLMSREEGLALIKNLTQNYETTLFRLTERITALELRLSSRLDVRQGELEAGKVLSATQKNNLSITVAIVAVLVTALSIVISLVVKHLETTH